MKSITEFTDQEAAEFIDLIRRVRKGMKDRVKRISGYLLASTQVAIFCFGRSFSSTTGVLKYNEHSN